MEFQAGHHSADAALQVVAGERSIASEAIDAFEDQTSGLHVKCAEYGRKARVAALGIPNRALGIPITVRHRLLTGLQESHLIKSHHDGQLHP